MQIGHFGDEITVTLVIKRSLRLNITLILIRDNSNFGS